MRAAAASAPARSRSAIAIAAPSSANRSAVASPMPRAPPVTKATRPSDRLVMFFLPVIAAASLSQDPGRRNRIGGILGDAQARDPAPVPALDGNASETTPAGYSAEPWTPPARRQPSSAALRHRLKCLLPSISPVRRWRRIYLFSADRAGRRQRLD